MPAGGTRRPGAKRPGADCDTVHKADMIRKIPYFTALPPDEVERLAASARLIAAANGEVLFREGEPAQGLYWLRSGRVKVVRYSPEGRQLIVREFRPGETFNEVGALDASENAATAVAGEEGTEALLIPGERIRGLAQRYPELDAAMMQAMACKLRFAMSRMNQLALLDVKARLAACLLERADEEGRVSGVTQEELAAELGTVRQVLGRTLAELQRAGIVEVKRGSIRILDREALASCEQRGRP